MTEAAGWMGGARGAVQTALVTLSLCPSVRPSVSRPPPRLKLVSLMTGPALCPTHVQASCLCLKKPKLFLASIYFLDSFWGLGHMLSQPGETLVLPGGFVE